MCRLSALAALERWAIAVIPLLVLLALPLLTVPVAVPVAAMGITPTPTFTPTPTVTPTPRPRPGLVDPVITKRGEPALALPGEQVTFTLEASNRGQHAAVDVVITDVIPEYLEILDVTTSQGTAEIDGQEVTIHAGVIGQGFVVEIVIRTRVTEDAPAPLDLTNVAILKSSNGGDRVSPDVTVVIPGPLLPETGSPVPYGALALVGCVLLAGASLWQRVRAPARPEPVDHDGGNGTAG